MPDTSQSSTLFVDLPFLERPYGPEEEGVLVYYDGPLLVRLPAQGEHELLALAVPELPAAAWPMWVVALTPEQLEQLLQNRQTLLRTVLAAHAHWLIKDYGAISRHLELSPLEFSAIPKEWLPGDVFLQRNSVAA
jgi:hypothetical protein